MNLSYKRINQQMVIVADGTIDSETSAIFLTEAEKIIAATSGNLILDFSRVSYVSSVGIQSLYNLLEKLTHQQRKLLLFGVTTNVMRVFRIVSLDKDIPIFATETEALAQ